jgi:GNAT superfamily N-acetyltransferase
MQPTIRPAVATDAQSCGRIIFGAFAALADKHAFPRDFPSAEVAADAAGMLIAHPGFGAIVAEAGGQPIGCNFVDLRAGVAGIGPIAVDPATQNRGTGRLLMQAAMDLARERNSPGIRLLQAAYHNRSLCLYTTLGFQTRAPVSLLNGTPLARPTPGHAVRPATSADAPACNALHHAIHGFARDGELADAIAAGGASVVDSQGRITGYTTGIGFRAHTAAEDNASLKSLIAAAPAISGPGFLLPTENHEVFAWCLANGFRLVMQMTLMTIGLYNTPRAPWMPSILY